MRRVQHPNVVRLYEVIDTPTTLYLVMELAEGGDLYDYILRHETGVAEGTAKRHFAQIVRAVAYCHELHVVHRDLKPENVVFFPQQGAVKLTDFGFSNLFKPGTMLATSCGSLAYSAPEILLGEEYDAPAVGKTLLRRLLLLCLTQNCDLRYKHCYGGSDSTHFSISSRLADARSEELFKKTFSSGLVPLLF